MASIDLRSDTVTHPTDAMRHAMTVAELGDDVFGDDPTVNALEARAAELLGKDAGVFVASGTMGNLVSLMAHLPRGHEAIAGASTHTVMDEAGGHAVVVGATIRALLERPDGTLDPAAIVDAWRDPTDLHEPPTGLVILENTHAHTGGRPLPMEYVREVARIAHERGVPLHIDGARLFNATVALGITPAEAAAPADSVTFCLSKGLAAPIGSVVVGSAPFVARARRARKLVGGGMRQVGVLAAAGLLALGEGPNGEGGMIERLAEDHANARRLAVGLAGLEGVRSPGGIAGAEDGLLDPAGIATNFVLFRVDRDRAAFLADLEARGVAMVSYAHGQVRAVTHYGITAADIDRVIEAVAGTLRDTAATAIPAGEPVASRAGR
ncbi:MAG: GntG family PLP-dependent aldolase [Candidatus Limnocylindrales bacterium]